MAPRDDGSGPSDGFAVTDVVTARACVARAVSVVLRAAPGTFTYRWTSDDGRTSAPVAVDVTASVPEVTVPLPDLAGPRPTLQLSLAVAGSPERIVPVRC